MPKKKMSKDDPDLRPLGDDADLDDWEAVPSPGPVRLAAMISVRFDPDAAELVRRAARIEELTQSEFVRQAALAAAERTIQRVDVPLVEWARAHEDVPTPPLMGGARTPPPATATIPPGADFRDFRMAWTNDYNHGQRGA